MSFISIIIYFCNLVSYSFEIFPSCSYPFTKRLNNGNYLLICSTGIFFYDSYFENITNSFETKMCQTESCYKTLACSQFLEEDDGFIIVFQKGFNYIFSENGTLLSNINIPYYREDISYSIVPYGHTGKKYFFYIIYYNDLSIIFYNYLFDSFSNNISLNNTYSYNNGTYKYSSISCQLMKYKSNNKLISCFYIDNKYHFYCMNFNPFNNLDIFSYNMTFLDDYIYYSSNIYLKSDVSTKYRDKEASCFYSEKRNNYIFCFGYDINNNKLINYGPIPIEINYFYTLDIKYFPELNKFLIAYFEQQELILFAISLNLEISLNDKIVSKNFDKNYNNYFNIIHLNENEYYILSNYRELNNIILISFKNAYFTLNCSYYYNYNQTECLDNIPEGYFLNDSTLKTIDKCHSDCKICDKKETKEYSNCNYCKNNLFLDLGNCLTSCKNGTFIDPYDNSIIM